MARISYLSTYTEGTYRHPPTLEKKAKQSFAESESGKTRNEPEEKPKAKPRPEETRMCLQMLTVPRENGRQRVKSTPKKSAQEKPVMFQNKTEGVPPIK